MFLKKHWDIDELIEHWTLLPNEVTLLGNSLGANRLGFALLLKFFQYETKFPTMARDIPVVVVDYIAKQVDVRSEEIFKNYDWNGRSLKRHRGEIRRFLGIRKASVGDAKQMVDWLIDNVLAAETDPERLKVMAEQQFVRLKIEPPTPGRIERLVRSALHTYETNFFTVTLQKLSLNCRAQIDALLSISDTKEDESQNSTPKTSLFHYLNTEPGRATVNNLLEEISKLQIDRILEGFR